ncbi:nuclear fragile X mental retardation protein interacting protein 1 [Entomortierella beljakovae]|nr:nuclear fragile X mental retardation protein interacting protein 1 [Entomortierella beljakovae]
MEQNNTQGQQSYEHAQNGQAGTQQSQQGYMNYNADQMAYYQQYQQYYQYQPQPSAAPSATVSALPPSYSTPLPPPKAKQNNQARRQYNNNGNPISQYQAQYQSSMQMGAAAASAATAALFQFGYQGSSGAPLPESNVQGVSATTNSHPVNSNSDPSQEWFSTYQAPSHQQRMAALTTMNNSGPMNRSYHPNQNGRRNNYNNNTGPNYKNNPRQNHQQRNGMNHQRGKNQHLQRQDQTKEQSEVAVAGAVAATTTTKAGVNVSNDKNTDGFHCDACDVTFHEEAKLKIHIAAHRTCPDCQYSASPSLVNDHRKLTHGSKNDADAQNPGTTTNQPSTTTDVPSTASGSNNSAPNRANNRNAKPKPVVNPDLLHPLAPTLNTPEEIAAWIAQRRKAWPTEANILKKEQERQEMIAKGQIVDEPSKPGFNNKDRRNRNNDNNNARNNKRGFQSSGIQVAETQPTKKPKGEGEADGDTIMDEVTSNATSENDDDEIMDPVKDAVTSKDPSVIGKVLLPTEKFSRPRKPCKYFLRGKCTRGDNCTFSHDASLTNKIQKTPVSNKKEIFRERPSLLQKLLAGEIKQEKNTLLEAIRYIVENNFFDKQEPPSVLVEEVV